MSGNLHKFNLGRAALKLKPGDTFTVKMQFPQNSLIGKCPVCASKRFLLSNAKKGDLQIHGCIDCKTMWTEKLMSESAGLKQVHAECWCLDGYNELWAGLIARASMSFDGVNPEEVK